MGNIIWIRTAVIEGDLVTVKKLLDEAEAADSGTGFAAVNAPFIFDMTPLHYACEYGQREVAIELLSRGADVEVKDVYIGYTPLHWAALGGHTEIIEVLIEKGACVDVKVGSNFTLSDTHTSTTALHLAAKNGHLSTVQSLVRHGANVNLKDRVGETALHMAIRAEELDVAEWLISDGNVDINMTTVDYNCTALHLACYYGHLSLASRLIVSGADLTVKDTYDCKTALAYVEDEDARLLLLSINPNPSIDEKAAVSDMFGIQLSKI